MRRLVCIASAVILILSFALGRPARAQFNPSARIPIPTTFVLQRTRGDPDPLDSKLIWLGVSQTTYSFVLRDAYTDALQGDSAWMTVWQSIRQFRPNLQIMGPNMFKLDRIKPGETVTVKGMCALVTRTFEITQVSPGAGDFAPPSHY